MEDNTNTSALDTIARELVRIRHGLEVVGGVPVQEDEVFRQPWGTRACKICGQDLQEKVLGVDAWTRRYVYVHMTGPSQGYRR